MTDAAARREFSGRVEIVGLGLIGSSIAQRLIRSGWHVAGRDIDHERVKRALELGIVSDTAPDPDADVVVIATPASAVIGVAHEVLADPERRAIVTDTAGVKAAIVASITDSRFVGGHPMAGSEQQGPDGADAALFEGATWVLTPAATTSARAIQGVRDLVLTLGASPLSLPPERHDVLVAVVSHVPHLTAANLMAVAADASGDHDSLLRLAAGGFRDMTRVAAGDSVIWPDIFQANRAAVIEALDALRARLDEARRIVADDDHDALVELLDYAKRARRNLPRRVPDPEDIVECRLPVSDRPGVLAEVTTTLGDLGVNIWDLYITHSLEGDDGVLVLAISAGTAERARAALSALGYHPTIGGLS